jgi:hypothetical protein
MTVAALSQDAVADDRTALYRAAWAVPSAVSHLGWERAFALVRHRRAVALFLDWADAQRWAQLRYPDGQWSIHALEVRRAGEPLEWR